MLLFDTHAHLNDEQFGASRDAVIARACQAGVHRILTVGTTVATSRRCVNLAEQHSQLFAAVGIQPNYVHEAQSGDWEAVVALAKNPRVIALGETGLDKYWHDAPFDLQQDYFDRHLRLSQATNIPFVVHMRDCEEDVLVMLREAAQRGPLRGVMHSFTGSLAGATECVALGMHISFAGMVTYKKSDALRAVAAVVPADRLLVETDSPYLSPHPHRNHRPNEPALVVHTAACLAEVRGVTLTTLAKQTTENALRLFDRVPQG